MISIKANKIATDTFAKILPHEILEKNESAGNEPVHRSGS